MAYYTIEAHQETIADLRTQLAKANERESVISCQLDSHIKRVKELESELDLRDVKIIDLQHQVGTLEFNRVTLKDLNKFAIEKKLNALDDLLEEIQCSVVVPKRYEQLQEPYLEGIKHCIQFIECQSKQIRKEQE
jgi:chromosome segregation ATPase